MLISKDNGGKPVGWRETYVSKDESVDVSVHRNVSTITIRDRTTGKVEAKTFFGRTPLPSDFDGKKGSKTSRLTPLGRMLVEPMGFESTKGEKTKEFCDATGPSRVLKGKEGNS